MDLSFVLYRSEARRKITRATVLDIIATSTRNNRKAGLTGFLHADRSHFLHYIEGPHGPLMRTLANIQMDRRHKDFLILADGVVEERLFRDWDMGQISDDHLPSMEIMQTLFRERRGSEAAALEMLCAFAAHAGKLDVTSINYE